MSSPPPPASQSAPPPEPELPMGLVHIARRNLQVEDLFSETCRRDRFCVTCWTAFCSHCCGSDHDHLGWAQDFAHVVRIDLDAADGRPVFPTRTASGHRIPASIAKIMASQDYTSRLPRDAFCMDCATAFCTDICSHHGKHTRLRDSVLRIEERDGQHCVRCTGDEWWLPHIGMALDDPVYEDAHEGYQLLPVKRMKPDICVECGAHAPVKHLAYCSMPCLEKHLRGIEERSRRREARHAARQLDNN